MNEMDFTEETEADRRERQIQEKKRKIGIAINLLLVLLVVITFGSCASNLAYRVSAPLLTIGGMNWDESWEQIGKKLGIDSGILPEGWTLDYNEEISQSDKVYMALYGYGTPEVVTYLDNNDAEAERNCYEAGWYIMTRGSGSEAAAEADLEEWQSVQSEACIRWEQLEDITAGVGGEAVTYSCYAYTYAEGQSQDYQQGIIAYVQVSDWAFSYQLDWNDSTGWTEEDGLEQLQQLLDTVYYST